MLRGTIFDIKRFAVHDGPGIRTSLFLKGCPLACRWCHNPEGLNPHIELWYNETRCIRCERCVQVCPEGALCIDRSGGCFIRIDRTRCKLSGTCIAHCPTQALQRDGREISVAELLEEIEKDRLFYETSGGGVTLTGGEPLYQPQFCLALLRSCRERGLTTALETCLYAPAIELDAVIPLVDHFLVDIKLIDAQRHLQWTGKDNVLILNNFRHLAEQHHDITVRIPLIKGFTDTSENIHAIEGFVQSINPAISIEKLAPNPLAPNKYRRLDKEFLCS